MKKEKIPKAEKDYTRLNKDQIESRQMDTLIGLSKGLIADGVINQSEAEFLADWLAQHAGISDNPMIKQLYGSVVAMLEDGVLDDEEAKELLSLLRSLVGEERSGGEIFAPTDLPLTFPFPDVVFAGNSFCFTGTFSFGMRKACFAVIEQRGGIAAKTVTQNLDYLVIGSYVTDSWKHESFGAKIMKAYEYAQQGCDLKIISEVYWAKML